MPEAQAVRVVIAEDDATVGESIRGVLEEAGYRVVAWVTDGVAAVERTIDLRPDVVLMDVQLPALNGIAAVRRIAETCPTPIVILSAYDQPEFVTLAVESGVGAYLTKPVNARELDRALSIAIARFADLQNLRKVNETMKAQAECSKRQAELNQTILNTAMDGYWLLDGTGRFVDVSDAYCRLLGYSREETLNMRASDLAADRGDKGSVSHVVDPLATVTGRFEMRQRRKDGVFIDLEVNATPLPAEGRIFAFVRDVTDRKRSERLAQSQRELAVALGQESDLPTAMEKVLDTALQIEGAECGGVFLVDEATGAFDLVCHRGFSETFVDLMRERSPSVSNAVLVAAGSPLYAGRDELANALPIAVSEGLKTVAVLPVLHEGKTVAALEVASRSLDEFSSCARDGLEAIVALLGGAAARLRMQTALKEGHANLLSLVEEARAARQELLDIIEFLPDATFVIDRDKKVIAWNRAIEEMTGTCKQDILGKGDYEYGKAFYGDPRPILIDLIGEEDSGLPTRYQGVHKSGARLFAEVFVPRLSGGRGAHLWVTASPLLDGQGHRVGAIESVREITERKQAEEALTRAEANYRSIFENALEGMFQTSPDGRVINANPALARLLGYASVSNLMEEVGDIGFQVYQDPELRRRLVEQVTVEGAVKGLEIPLFRRDGTRIWVSLNAIALQNESGTSQRFEGYIADITERKRAEENLRAARQRLADIIDFLPDATFVIDMDKKVIAWNRATEEMTGTRKEDILGQGDYAYAIPWYGERRPILIDLIGDEESEFRSKYEYVHKVGNTLYAEVFVPSVFGGRGAELWVTASPFLDSEGNRVGAIESVRDITERKRAEEQLRQAHVRLERALKFTEALLSAIPTPVFYKDAEGRYLGCNRAFTEIMGATSEQIVGKTVYELWPSEHAEVYHRKDLELMGNPARQAYEFKVRDKHDLERIVIYAKDVFRDENEQVAGIVGAFMDITERKWAEEALRNAEEKYRGIFENAIEGMFQTSASGAFVTANPAMARMLGYESVPEFIGSISDIETQLYADPDVRREFIGRVITEGVVLGFETRFRRKNGSMIWGSLSARAVRDERGDLNYLEGFLIDITERKRAQAALAESEVRYRALYEDNPTMYFTVDGQGGVLSVNQFGAQQLGYQAEELVGKPVLDIFVPEDRELVRQQVRRLLENPSRVGYWEFRKVRKDGSVLWVRETARVVKREGEAPLVLIVCEDITDRKRAEEQQVRLQHEISTAAAEWTATFDSVKSVLVLTDLDGVVKRLNVAARDLAGRDWSDALGHAIGDLGECEPWRTASVLVKRVADVGSATAEQVHGDPPTRTWNMEATRLSAAPDRVIVAILDITALLDLQESLRRRETMSAMGSLVGGVAHEVRNPLFAISGLLDALDAKYEHEGDLLEFLNGLRQETDRLTTLMRALLEYGRPVSEERVPASLGLAISEAIQLCQRDASTRRVKVMATVPDRLPPVPMDRPRMVEVFRNLVENSIQHSPAGETVVITAQLTETEQPGWVEVRVQDCGEGFRESEMGKVFEPFFSHRAGGTGLGLSIVHRVVTAHNGAVEARNRPGGGGVVTVTLPL